jgi:hypothetical protein
MAFLPCQILVFNLFRLADMPFFLADRATFLAPVATFFGLVFGFTFETTHANTSIFNFWLARNVLRGTKEGKSTT